MGMFDELKCKYPLPMEGANDIGYQTKDTPAQFLDNYEIREDGTLWHLAYDTEDQSVMAQWLEENPGKTPNDAPQDVIGIHGFIGCMTRINERWEQVPFKGEIRFYEYNTETKRWLEWSAYFVDGKVSVMQLISNGVRKIN